MAISIQKVVDQCSALLDSEGSDRYLFDRDFLPAILATNDYLVSIFNSAFAENKLSEESLKELTFCKVWQTSLYSRFAFDSTDVGHSLWTILAIHPKITTIPASPTIAPATAESVYMDKVSFRSSSYSCKRLTAEEWALKDRNMFMPGSSLITCADLMEYAYIDYTDYTGGYALTNDKFEIEIAPDVQGELIAMRYLKVPTAPTLISQNLEFPESLTNLAVQLCMRFLGVKQGEVPTYQITNSEIDMLIKQLS